MPIVSCLLGSIDAVGFDVPGWSLVVLFISTPTLVTTVVFHLCIIAVSKDTNEKRGPSRSSSVLCLDTGVNNLNLIDRTALSLGYL